MKKNTFGIVSSALSGILLSLVFACNMPSTNQDVALNGSHNDDGHVHDSVENVKMTKYSISGVVQFDSAFKASSGFSVKAHITNITSGASVTLLDLNGNALGPSVSTNASGQFLFTPSSTFAPTTGQIFVLEASKRGSADGQGPLLAMRTFVRWNGTSFDSITGPTIAINTYTTALAIIAAKGEVTRDSTIGKVTVVNASTSTVTPIPASGSTSGADATKINTVTTLVRQALNMIADPVATITFNAGNYSLALSGTANLTRNSQIDRLALPSLNIVINGYNGFTKQVYDSLGMTKAMRDAAKDKYNSESPSTDVANYRDFWTTALGAVFPNNKANAAANATALTPDVYTLDMSKATSFATLNGRLLSDDVVDVELKLLSGVNTATDGVNSNDKAFTTTFPYLASPF